MINTSSYKNVLDLGTGCAYPEITDNAVGSPRGLTPDPSPKMPQATVRITNPLPGGRDRVKLSRARKIASRGIARLDEVALVLTYLESVNSIERMIAAENNLIFQQRAAEIGYDAALKERTGKFADMMEQMTHIPIVQKGKALDFGKNTGGARPLRAML